MHGFRNPKNWSLITAWLIFGGPWARLSFTCAQKEVDISIAACVQALYLELLITCTRFISKTIIAWQMLAVPDPRTDMPWTRWVRLHQGHRSHQRWHVNQNERVLLMKNQLFCRSVSMICIALLTVPCWRKKYKFVTRNALLVRTAAHPSQKHLNAVPQRPCLWIALLYDKDRWAQRAMRLQRSTLSSLFVVKITDIAHYVQHVSLCVVTKIPTSVPSSKTKRLKWLWLCGFWISSKMRFKAYLCLQEKPCLTETKIYNFCYGFFVAALQLVLALW